MIGTAQLATELTLSPEEFDKYYIASVPTSIAFQLKEFTVSVFLFVQPTSFTNLDNRRLSCMQIR